MPDTNGVKLAIEAAGSGRKLAEDMDPPAGSERRGVSMQALYAWQRQGYFPLERAKEVAERYGLPLRELVPPDVREAMDAALLS